MNKILIYIVVAFVVGIGVGFFIPRDSRVVEPQTHAGDMRLPRPGAVEHVDAELSRYAHDVRGFSITYPSELSVQEFDEENGGMTIVFQQPGEQRGFQIFITPYAGETLTEARITQDIPSGVIDNPTEVIIGKGGDIRALHFTSHAPIIGESSEVWFLKDGYLYEVTTYAALDSWLAGILQTVEFR